MIKELVIVACCVCGSPDGCDCFQSVTDVRTRQIVEQPIPARSEWPGVVVTVERRQDWPKLPDLELHWEASSSSTATATVGVIDMSKVRQIT